MLSPKPYINRLAPVIHGGTSYQELRRFGLPAKGVLDFSVSVNPFGPPPGIKKALAEVVISTYPDRDTSELKTTLAAKLSLSTANLIIGNGSTELIRLAATAYFGPGDNVLIPQPTYGDYEQAAAMVNAKVLKPMAGEEAGFRFDTSQLLALIHRHHPKGIFLGNPNNPTGAYLTREEVAEIITAAPDTLVVLDEAYVAFTENAWSSLDLINRGNLLILRSMTKDYALAGLRLGYAVASEAVITALERVKPPWSVSSPAQKAGIFALNQSDYFEGCSRRLHRAKEFLIRNLSALGYEVLPSSSNFFLVRVGDAAEFRSKLLKKGIMVRDATSFGLPQYIRLAPRRLAECRRLLQTIREIMTEGGF
ncbi:MAG: histidinol-phosphate transaminase [Dehalococcoidales bacterium]